MLDSIAAEDRSLSAIGAVGWVCLAVVLMMLSLDLSAAIRPGLSRNMVNIQLCAALAFSCVTYGIARFHLPLRSAIDALALRPIAPLVVALAAAAGFTILFAVSWLSSLVEQRWPYAPEELAALRSAYSVVGWKQRIAFAIVTTALGPLVEEALFRGVMFRGLRFSYSRVITIAITAALFTLCHLSPRMFVHVLPAGLVLGTLRAMTGSMAAPLLAHMVFNGVSTFQVLAGTVAFESQESATPAWQGLAGLAGTAVCLGWLHYLVSRTPRQPTNLSSLEPSSSRDNA